MKCPQLSALASALSLVTLVALFALPPQCVAWHGQTWYAWHRTWHAPYPMETPLRDYYIPRTPGRCDRTVNSEGFGYTGACGCGDTVHGSVAPAARPYAGQGCVACDPGHFERLGQIPNEIELSIAGPAAPADR